MEFKIREEIEQAGADISTTFDNGFTCFVERGRGQEVLNKIIELGYTVVKTISMYDEIVKFDHCRFDYHGNGIALLFKCEKR